MYVVTIIKSECWTSIGLKKTVVTKCNPDSMSMSATPQTCHTTGCVMWPELGLCLRTRRKSFFAIAAKTYFLPSSSANPSPQCDLANGWMTYGSNCYKFKSDTRKSWTSARHDCVADGADLVSITSAGENQFVTSNMGETHLDLWIGLSTLVREA